MSDERADGGWRKRAASSDEGDLEAAWAAVAVDPGLCRECAHVLLTRTRRGPVYVRCGAAAQDTRLRKYPRLPVCECVAFTPAPPTA